MKRYFILIFFILLISSCDKPLPSPSATSVGSQSATLTTPTPTSMPSPIPSPTLPTAPIYEKNRWLGRGVNLGNALEAPQEGQWGLILQEEYFRLIKEAGFDSVRIPIRWNAHASQLPPYQIEPQFFERVDWAVNQALANDLTVVINIHLYLEMYSEPKAHKDRFISIWSQIADHYKEYPDHLFFELLNEPNGSLGMDTWNLIAAEAIAVVRKTNPDRPIMVGPGDWNSFSRLDYLKLPEDDRNLIVTIHYYLPYHFTHQGADWVKGADAWLGLKWKGDPVEIQMVRLDFTVAAVWAKQHDRPVYLGEFGSYSKADIDSRQQWTTAISRIAEENGFSWAYWEFGAGFGVYDPSLKKWNQPILTSLIPKEENNE